MTEYIINNPCAEAIDISNEIPSTVFGHWKGYWSWENQSIVDDIMNVFIPYLKEHHIKILISSHQNLETVDLDYVEWIQNQLIPKCIEIGMKIEIIIDSQHDMGNVSLYLIYSDIENAIDTPQYITPKVSNIEQAKILAQQIADKIHINRHT